MLIGIRNFSKIKNYSEVENEIKTKTNKHLSNVVTVIVDDNYQRKQLGKRLLEQFMDFCGEEYAKFVLIPHTNNMAQKFFEKSGFENVSTVRKWVFDKGFCEDNVYFLNSGSTMNSKMLWFFSTRTPFKKNNFKKIINSIIKNNHSCEILSTRIILISCFRINIFIVIVL